jgi:hypothetical protein
MHAWGHYFAKGMHSIAITFGFGAVSVPVPLLDFGQGMQYITITWTK